MTMSNTDTQNHPGALILGASGGIGTALCRLLAFEGWNLVLAGKDAEALGRLAAETGGRVLEADLTEGDAIGTAFEEAARQVEPLRGVVNCLGSVLLKPAHITTDAEWEEVVALNLTSAFRTVRESARRMRKGGSVVLLSSAAARIGLQNHEAIAAAKAGVEGLVRSAAASYAGRRLRFNAVAPGLVDTPLTSAITGNEASLAASLAMHPLGRVGRPEDIGSAISWLLDPRNDWVTGQVIGVDGGLAGLKVRSR
jgi:NAD(P)-dependent dehydrogenase (short-subunit alcohol dehydrogenase family)